MEIVKEAAPAQPNLYERLFSTHKLAPRRLASVDAFRAITMFLMIFVNDLWSLQHVPGWLGHAGESEDRLGLADTVFPAFLFIVGLSIPFAMQARQSKGFSKGKTFLHILARSFSLLVMGIFQVNLEHYDNVGSLLSRPWWQIGITIAFFLVWLDYPPTVSPRKKQLLKGAGILMLGLLALLFRGDRVGNYAWMHTGWYGTLGLIGWSYLICASIYLFVGDRLVLLAGAFVFFFLFNLNNNLGWLAALDPISKNIDNGAIAAFTMAGILTSALYRQLTREGQTGQGILVLVTLALILAGAGIALRSFWGISKEDETPSWVLICTAINIIFFIGLLYLVDIRGRTGWIGSIRPAGTSTLTCYLLPSIHYAILNLLHSGYSLPLFFRSGSIGILKSLFYAWLIIRIAGFLEKKGIRLAL